jgi:hypothetical protein
VNESVENQLESIVMGVVRSVLASRSRKRLIEEELLAHVTAVYDEEFEALGDERAAVDETRRRFGVAEDVKSQLQASVPLLERWFLTPEREILMSRWFWILAVFAVFFGPAIALPALAKFRDEGVLPLVPLAFGGLITLAGLAGVGYGTVRRFARPAK